MSANPGRMDRPITVQVRTATQDGAGGRSETWATDFTAWAELVEMRANELIAAGAERTHAMRRFRIRWADIGAGTHRIIYLTKPYNITGIVEEGRKDRLLLTCESLQATS